jgi:5-dehydro-4-deoxyglucarate dehydratase
MLDGVLFFPVTPFGADGTVHVEQLAAIIAAGRAAAAGLTGEVSEPRMVG